jgi:hypothetical protein
VNEEVGLAVLDAVMVGLQVAVQVDVEVMV